MIAIRKLKWADVENQYRNSYTRQKYKCLLRKFVSALAACPTCVTDGEECALFNTQEDWENFVRSYCDSFEKKSMKYNAYLAIRSLIEHFHMPAIRDLDYRWKSTHHKGFTSAQRKAIIEYCLSTQDDHDRLMCVTKFTAITFLDTGVRCSEFKKVVQGMLNSPKIVELLETTDIANMSISDILKLPNIDNICKITIVNESKRNHVVRVSPRMIKLWKKVCEHGQENDWDVTPAWMRKRLRKLLAKLNMDGTTDDFGVYFIAGSYVRTRDLIELSRYMEHKEIEQTQDYVSMHNEIDQAVSIISDVKITNKNDHNAQVAYLEMEIEELKNTILKLENLIDELLKNKKIN